MNRRGGRLLIAGALVTATAVVVPAGVAAAGLTSWMLPTVSEVTRLKQQATSTASTAVKTSRQQLSTATQKIKDNAAQRRAGTSTDASAAVTGTGSRRRLRLPRFARQGVRSDGSVVPVAGPVATATETATPDTSASSTPISQASASPPVEDA
jgi:hypothetical protein